MVVRTQQRLPFETRGLPIQQRFEVFHAHNPRVYELFRRFAREAKGAGRARFSADAILHRVRWEVTFNPDDRLGEAFKINDHFSSRYARLLIAEDPAFEGFFQLREIRRH